MRQYELKEQKEISKMICNQCGKEIPVSGGHAMEGVFRVDYEWGISLKKTGKGTPLICVKRVMISCFDLFRYRWK